MPKVVFNGQEYDSPDSMPPDIRQLFELTTNMLSATGKDGKPGVIDMTRATVMSATQFIIGGKSYSSLDELPADVRQKYEQAMQRFDTNQNGIPDMLEGSPFSIGQQPQKSQAPVIAAAPTPTQPALVTVVGEGRGMPSALTFAIILIVILVGVVLFLLFNR